jgi:hypothetical protein
MPHWKRSAFLTWTRIAVTVQYDGKDFPFLHKRAGQCRRHIDCSYTFHRASCDKFPEMFGFEHFAIIDPDDVIEPHSVVTKRLTK